MDYERLRCYGADNFSNKNAPSSIIGIQRYFSNKVVFISKYQIKHINGLTFDFLYKISKTLQDKNSFMVLGGGKGNEPLVFNDGGKPYRGFLEGKVQDNSYCLILHLSNQEYKTI